MAVVLQNKPRKQSPVAQKTIAHYVSLSEKINVQAENQVLVAKRQAAQKKLQSLGLPTRRDEDWQYTSLTPWMQEQYEQKLPGRVSFEQLSDFLPAFETLRMVFVDGVYAAELSSDLAALPKGLDVEQTDATNAALADSEEPFEILHDMLVERQVKISVAKGAMIELPIHLVYLQTQAQQLTNLTLQVELAAGSQATVLQQAISFDENNSSFVNGFAQFSIGEDAVCQQVMVQDMNRKSFYFANQRIQQAARSHFNTLYIGLGGLISRHQNRLTLCGEHAEASQNSIVLGAGKQVMDSRTQTDHNVPNGSSQQLHKFVLNDQARGVFNGMIYVAKGAQKTDGQMDNKNLLLSNEAKMDTKPQLEIYADDVKCSHGCASGQIDEDQIFYCQARGIRRPDAVQLITQAFLLEPLETVGNFAIREWLKSLVNRRLIAVR